MSRRRHDGRRDPGSRPFAAWPLAALTGALLLLALPVVGLAQDPGAAASPAPKQATSISLAFEPARMQGLPHYLVAKLVSQDGSAVVGGRVTMRRKADAFGGRTVTLGRATTDNAGIARVPVEPREPAYHVTASYGGDEDLASSTAESDIAFPAELVLQPQHVPQGGLVDPQLRPLGDVMPIVIGLIVLGIWILLLALTVMTLVRIRSDGSKEADRSSSEKRGTA